MKRLLLIISALFSMTEIQANSSLDSELAHGMGGVAMAGVIVAAVDYTEYNQDRRVIGFVGSSVIGVVMQIVDYTEYKDAKGQLLDAAWHIVGSAIGAYVTDSFILSPVVKDSPSEGKYVGLVLQHSF